MYLLSGVTSNLDSGNKHTIGSCHVQGAHVVSRRECYCIGRTKDVKLFFNLLLIYTSQWTRKIGFGMDFG